MTIQISLLVYALIGIPVVSYFLATHLRVLIFIASIHSEGKSIIELLIVNFNWWKKLLFFTFIFHSTCYILYRKVICTGHLKYYTKIYMGPVFQFIFVVFYGTLIYLVGIHFISLLEHLLDI